MDQRPSLSVAVVMRREPITGPMSRWQSSRWLLDEVLIDDGGFGSAPRVLHKTETEERCLYPGFTVSLFADDTDGYYLNLTSNAPCWFVLWRMENEVAVPTAVSLSYHDAGRWLDAQENVEQKPAPTQVVEWLEAFNHEYHVEEPRRRKRPESFKSLTDRFGNPASISTEKNHGRR
jgi:Protein of unknown function (DUF3305)